MFLPFVSLKRDTRKGIWYTAGAAADGAPASSDVFFLSHSFLLSFFKSGTNQFESKAEDRVGAHEGVKISGDKNASLPHQYWAWHQVQKFTWPRETSYSTCKEKAA